MKLISVNPFTNKIISEVEELSGHALTDQLNKVKKVTFDWMNSKLTERIILIRSLSKLLRDDKDRLAKLITQEMGKPIRESLAEVEKCAWLCDYYSEDAVVFLKDEEIVSDASRSFVRYAPLGTILAVMPWNFPFWQLFRCAVPALTAGNSLLLKHASNVQLCAQAIEDLFLKAGFPEGVLLNLAIASAGVHELIRNDIVKAVSLTGSVTAGRKVAETAGSVGKKTVLELGGSNPFLVLEDADLDLAVATGIKARMQNAGQSCIAGKRFIIHEKVYDAYVRMYSEALKNLRVGDPLLAETDIGPLSSSRQAEEVHQQVQDSVILGAEILTGGSPSGAFYAPTIIEKTRPGMPVFDEEVFGPVAAFCKARNLEEMIKLANATSFGLGVSLFTSDIKKAESIISRFHDGAVFVNELVKSDPRLPFGGTRNSGYGRELSLHGIREFVNVQTIYIK